MKHAEKATTPREEVTVVTEPTAELLNERQQTDYRNQREQCLDWLLVFGKDPKKVDGYAQTTRNMVYSDGVLAVQTEPHVKHV